MTLSEQLGEIVRRWRSFGIDQMRDWELQAIDLEKDKKDLQKRNRKLEDAVQEGDQRFSDLQDEHKDALDRNRELEATVERGPKLKIVDGDVWLSFDESALISVEAIIGGRGPIVKRNARKWRDGVLADLENESDR